MLTDCVCPAIMKFMGDFPLKGQTEQDLVTTILKVHTKTRTHSLTYNIKMIKREADLHMLC